MLESGKITPLQAGFLMMLTVMGTANLTMPAIVSKYAEMDAWIAMILAIFPHFALIWVISKMGNTYPRESFVLYIRKITGKHLGVLIVLGYLWYQIFVVSMIIRTVSEFLLTSFMSDTPIEFIIIILLLLTALIVRSGLEVMGRAVTFILPIFLISFVVVLLLLIREMDFHMITPILENGLKPVIYGSIYPALWRGEFILMLFLWPYMNQPHQGFRSMIQASIIILLIMLPITFASTTVFGPLTPRIHFPTFSLVEYISLGGFLTRLDAVFMAVWIAGVFIKIGVFYYVICLVLSELLGLKEYRSLVFPMGIIIGVLAAIVAPNIAIYEHLYPAVVVPLNCIFEYIIPFTLLALLYLKGLHKTKKTG